MRRALTTGPSRHLPTPRITPLSLRYVATGVDDLRMIYLALLLKNNIVFLSLAANGVLAEQRKLLDAMGKSLGVKRV